jgi:4-hydroxy-tetrahydrodipicolinate synthase
MDLYSGEDFLNLPMLAIGGAGLISVTSNVAPKLMKKLYNLVSQNKLDEANSVQDFLLPLEDACFLEVNPIPVKAAYNMIRGCAAPPTYRAGRRKQG